VCGNDYPLLAVQLQSYIALGISSSLLRLLSMERL